MFNLRIKRPPDKKALPKFRRFKKRAKPNMMRAFGEIAIRAERQVKAVDLSRGGGFRITKATPRWIKNTSPYPRVGNGTLRASWRSRPAKMIAGDIMSKIVSREKYARIIDRGGFAGPGRRVWLKGWPYIGPMLKRNRSRFLRIAGRRVFAGFSGA